MVHTLIIAGSTAHTATVAQFFAKDPHFEISAIITPAPKRIGRKQILTQNPLHEFALTHQIPTVLIEKKLDSQCQQSIFSLLGPNTPYVDFVLVVDFGYYVPGWLLKLARIQPLNVHPSTLPAWRGSSPGQFVLLHGESQSAVTLITVATGMDQGDIWFQPSFAVDNKWNQTDYYQAAFDLIAPQLPTVLTQIATKSRTATPQPLTSPTAMARRLEKSDSFIPWSVLRATQTNHETWQQRAKTDLAQFLEQQSNAKMIPVLAQLLSTQECSHWSVQLERACRAFSPWPKIWTTAPTPKGEQRLIILETTLKNDALQLNKVQLEGKTPASFNQLITSLILDLPTNH